MLCMVKCIVAEVSGQGYTKSGAFTEKVHRKYLGRYSDLRLVCGTPHVAVGILGWLQVMPGGESFWCAHGTGKTRKQKGHSLGMYGSAAPWCARSATPVWG